MRDYSIDSMPVGYDDALPAGAINVHDPAVAGLANKFERIKMDVVPGKGMTYDGYDTIEACVAHIEPGIYSGSKAERQQVVQIAKHVLGLAVTRV